MTGISPNMPCCGMACCLPQACMQRHVITCRRHTSTHSLTPCVCVHVGGFGWVCTCACARTCTHARALHGGRASIVGATIHLCDGSSRNHNRRPPTSIPPPIPPPCPAGLSAARTASCAMCTSSGRPWGQEVGRFEGLPGCRDGCAMHWLGLSPRKPRGCGTTADDRGEVLPGRPPTGLWAACGAAWARGPSIAQLLMGCWRHRASQACTGA